MHGSGFGLITTADLAKILAGLIIAQGIVREKIRTMHPRAGFERRVFLFADALDCIAEKAPGTKMAQVFTLMSKHMHEMMADEEHQPTA